MKRDTTEGDNELHFRGVDPKEPVRHDGMACLVGSQMFAPV